MLHNCHVIYDLNDMVNKIQDQIYQNVCEKEGNRARKLIIVRLNKLIKKYEL